MTRLVDVRMGETTGKGAHTSARVPDAISSLGSACRWFSARSAEKSCALAAWKVVGGNTGRETLPAAMRERYRIFLKVP